MSAELAVILSSVTIRVLAIFAGILSIYVGYRLFSLVPEQKGGEGRLTLPGGASFFASKVAPGVFFALFGTGLTGYSVTQPMTYSAIGIDPGSGERREVSISGFNAGAPSTGRQSRLPPDSAPRPEVIGTLNAWFAELSDDTDAEAQARSARRTAVREAKLALMREIWNQAIWGSYDDFHNWVVRQMESGSPPEGSEAAVEIFQRPAP